MSPTNIKAKAKSKGKSKAKSRIKKIALTLVVLLVASALTPFVINLWVVKTTESSILSQDDPLLENNNPQCILILGAGLNWDGSPSPMLKDRLDTGISLYNKGVAPKLLLSGDHGKEFYDEIKSMKTYCLERDVPFEDIFLDHAGFSTYESIIRAQKVFEVDRLIIVTQEYHLFRALYTAKKTGLEVYGVSASLREYSGQELRDQREFFARNKDFLQTLYWPDPTYLGDPIPITGDSGPSHIESSKP
ncbi:MAG: ElyC/SanA/YdcF family protein [Anaerovoracaceae bacterium]|jgi:vancomycin permeability regulator SanA|nr:ElyC/SanA/YdcF family protein [Anaerovoracaceae bacterium]